MSEKDVLVQSAVTLLATGRADTATEALSMATQLVAEVERAYKAQTERGKERSKKKSSAGRSTRSRTTSTGSRAKGQRSKAKADGKPMPIRALRVLQRMGVLDAEEAPNARKLKRRVCEAHLFSAKNCGQATVQLVADWFQAHGETLVAECRTFSEDWMSTARCDEEPGK